MGHQQRLLQPQRRTGIIQPRWVRTVTVLTLWIMFTALYYSNKHKPVKHRVLCSAEGHFTQTLPLVVCSQFLLSTKSTSEISASILIQWSVCFTYSGGKMTFKIFTSSIFPETVFPLIHRPCCHHFSVELLSTAATVSPPCEPGWIRSLWVCGHRCIKASSPTWKMVLHFLFSPSYLSG